MSSKFGLTSKPWEPGRPIYINKLVWGEPEINRVVECLLGDWFGGNSIYNTELEKNVAEFSGLKYVQTTNSGSAALEVAVQTLVQRGVWKPGDKVIVPLLNFPTSVSSALMAGLEPVYVDVGKNTYVIDDVEFEKALAFYPEIVGAIIPALLGNVPNLDRIKELLGERPLILDSCDVMGSKWNGKEVASYGTLAAYSFYGSHHISTFGVGGALATDNKDFYDTAHSMVFWGRDFKWDVDDKVTNFLHRYTYATLGLDAQMSAVQAAFGLGQFERLPEIIAKRYEVFRSVLQVFGTRLDWFDLPERVSDKADISWFGFPICIKAEAPFKREDLVAFLLEKNVEVRPIFTNLLENPPFANKPHIRIGDGKNSRYVYERGIFLPSFAMTAKQHQYYLEIITEFLLRYKR